MEEINKVDKGDDKMKIEATESKEKQKVAGVDKTNGKDGMEKEKIEEQKVLSKAKKMEEGEIRERKVNRRK